MILVTLVDEGKLEREDGDGGQAVELTGEDEPVERVLHLLKEGLVSGVDGVQVASCPQRCSCA